MKKVKSVSKQVGLHGATGSITVTFDDKTAFTAIAVDVIDDILHLIDFRGVRLATPFPFSRSTREIYYWAGVKTSQDCVSFKAHGKRYKLPFRSFNGQKPEPIKTPDGMEDAYRHHFHDDRW